MNHSNLMWDLSELKTSNRDCSSCRTNWHENSQEETFKNACTGIRERREEIGDEPVAQGYDSHTQFITSSYSIDVKHVKGGSDTTCQSCRKPHKKISNTKLIINFWMLFLHFAEKSFSTFKIWFDRASKVWTWFRAFMFASLFIVLWCVWYSFIDNKDGFWLCEHMKAYHVSYIVYSASFIC